MSSLGYVCTKVGVLGGPWSSPLQFTRKIAIPRQRAHSSDRNYFATLL